jgi:manganese transport protein
VMPHNLYLHSALVQTRKIKTDATSIRQALKWNFVDSAIALNIAFLVNSAILILAATVFFKNGRTDVAEIGDAHQLLEPLLGTSLAPVLFAVALIAAGQSSTVTGTLAGQIVMEGYLRLRMNPILRRLLTRLLAIIPAVLVIGLVGEDQVDKLLIFSQVILSMQLGFAVIPLIHFCSDKKKMGEFVIKPYVQIAAWLIASVLVYLNVRLLISEAVAFFETSSNVFLKALIIVAGISLASLLAYILLAPWFTNRAGKKSDKQQKRAAVES